MSLCSVTLIHLTELSVFLLPMSHKLSPAVLDTTSVDHQQHSPTRSQSQLHTRTPHALSSLSSRTGFVSASSVSTVGVIEDPECDDSAPTAVVDNDPNLPVEVHTTSTSAQCQVAHETLVDAIDLTDNANGKSASPHDSHALSDNEPILKDSLSAPPPIEKPLTPGVGGGNSNANKSVGALKDSAPILSSLETSKKATLVGVGDVSSSGTHGSSPTKSDVDPKSVGSGVSTLSGLVDIDIGLPDPHAGVGDREHVRVDQSAFSQQEFDDATDGDSEQSALGDAFELLSSSEVCDTLRRYLSSYTADYVVVGGDGRTIELVSFLVRTKQN